jgi:hypothetical protein
MRIAALHEAEHAGRFCPVCHLCREREGVALYARGKKIEKKA